MRQKVVKKLARFAAFAVENEVGDGAPDVCTTRGWIELKVAKIPQSPQSTVRIDLRNSQRIWHDRWFRFGGKSVVMTLLEHRKPKLSPRPPCEWYVHDGPWAAKNFGTASLAHFRFHALERWNYEPTSSDLLRMMETMHD